MHHNRLPVLLGWMTCPRVEGRGPVILSRQEGVKTSPQAYGKPCITETTGYLLLQISVLDEKLKFYKIETYGKICHP